MKRVSDRSLWVPHLFNIATLYMSEAKAAVVTAHERHAFLCACVALVGCFSAYHRSCLTIYRRVSYLGRGPSTALKASHSPDTCVRLQSAFSDIAQNIRIQVIERTFRSARLFREIFTSTANPSG